MTKKVSLAGRKRTSELSQDQNNTQYKVEQLLELKKEAQPEKSSSEPKQTTPAPEAPAKIPEVAQQPTIKPTEKPKSAPAAKPADNKGVEAVYQKEVKAAVSKLYQAWRKLGEAGTYNRLAHTPMQQKRLFLEEIKLVMLERAEFNESQGMNEFGNQQDCQRYVNDIVEGLRAVGLPMNPLSVTC